MTMTATSRQRLEAVRQRKSAARDAISRARRAVDAAIQGSDQQAQRAAEVALETAHGELEMASELESVILSQVGGLAPGMSDSFLEDPNMVRELEALANSRAPIGAMNLGQAFSRDEVLSIFQQGQMLAQVTPGEVQLPGDNARRGPFYGVVPQLRRRLRLLDLIPSASMDTGNTIPYVQEIGSFDTALETAEDAIKPQAEYELNDAEAVAKTIAHWIKSRRQVLADVVGLQASLTNRLFYGVQRRLENEILAGDGTGENILGILHTTGIADVAFVADDPLTDLTLDAITTVFMSDAEPTAVVVNPLDVSAMLKAKATGSGERLDSEGAFASTSETIWDLPRIQTRVMPQGQALVGDFAQGATLFVREGVNIRISDSDQDDFIRNRVTLLGEGRFALAIWQPSCFAVVNFAAPAGG